jgi:hypothetical protein
MLEKKRVWTIKRSLRLSSDDLKNYERMMERESAGRRIQKESSFLIEPRPKKGLSWMHSGWPGHFWVMFE